jgi:hypothetical protein
MGGPVVPLSPEQSAINARASLLSGVKADGQPQVGVAVDLRSSAGPSSLMIPDATKVGEGEPVYLSKPVELQLAKLESFLLRKGVEIPEKPVDLKALMKNTTLVCGAFYYSAAKMNDDKKTVERPGALLMSFAIKNDTGIIASLTGDKDLGDLFDVVGVSLRIVKCPQERLSELQAYVKQLSAEPVASGPEEKLEAGSVDSPAPPAPQPPAKAPAGATGAGKPDGS